MISFLAKYKTFILVVVISAFMASIFYVGYGVVSTGIDGHSVIAVVGGEKVKGRTYNNLLKSQEMEFRRLGLDLDENTITFLKQRVLQSLMFESAMVQSAVKYGLHVSDFEVAYAIKTSPAFTFNGLFDKKAYVWTVRNQLGINPAEFEAQQSRNMLMNKMGELVVSSYKATPQELKYNFKIQYGTEKDFEKKKADFTPTIWETKSKAAQDAFLTAFNAANEVKVLLQE